jgi:endonuclease/exonuclease/phosphatase family metal-dependent hydrolase
MARKLDDAFSEGGSGIGETYAGSSFPAFRIDYILHSNNLKSFNYKRDKVNYSDHYPVKCNISY